VSDRVPFPNVGAESGDVGGAFPPVQRLVQAWKSLVDDPPWPWLERARGLVPWMATVDAAKRALERRLPLVGAPPFVVERVHDKAFALRIARDRKLDETVPDLAVILEPDEVSTSRVETIAAEWPRWAWHDFTVKPRWGTAGRGRVRGVDGRAAIGAAIGAFERGAIVEPWLHRMIDMSSLWHVDEHGEPHLLGTTKQIVRGAGVYLGCDVVITDVGAMAGTEWDEPAIERARVVVEAAAREGYRGPCGVDAFTWKDEAGAVHLRGVVELNARFTAGHVALGLIARRAPSVGARFRFTLDSDDVLSVVP
jgi:hypothetical protein